MKHGGFINKTHGKLRTLHVCSTFDLKQWLKWWRIADWNRGQTNASAIFYGEAEQRSIRNCIGGCSAPRKAFILAQGLVNVPIEHHPTIGDVISNRYLKVMFKIPKKGHLPTPVSNLGIIWCYPTRAGDTSQLFQVVFDLFLPLFKFFLLNVSHFYLTIMAGRPMRDSEVTNPTSLECFDLVYVHIVAILLRQPITSRLGEMDGNGASKWGFAKIGVSLLIIHVLMGFSIINHPFWGTPISGNPQMNTLAWTCFV